MTALVTGASSGIGAAFVARLAARGHDIVAVARGEGGLDRLADTVRARYGVAVDTLPADLSTRDGQDAVARRLSEPGDRAPVDLLVNNAGSATAPDFADTDPADLRALLELNVASVQHLMRAALPGMLDRRSGAVINVSSMNAYLTLPGGASAYGAGKSFVTSLTKGVALPLRGSGVRVMVLCPGPTRTGFHDRSLTGRGIEHALGARSPEWIVEKALTDLDGTRIVSIPGLRAKAIAAVGNVVPASAMAPLVRGVRSRRDRVTAARPAPRRLTADHRTTKLHAWTRADS